jgi:hypothetical protein
MSSSSTNCSIRVNITNNTGQGPITFNTFTFLENTGGDFNANDSQPFTITNVIEDTTTVPSALYAQGYSGYYNGEPTYSATVGTAIFNMPNGDTLTISWSLKPNVTNNVPTLSPSSNTYVYNGLTDPSTIDSANFVFDVSVS